MSIKCVELLGVLNRRCDIIRNFII